MAFFKQVTIAGLGLIGGSLGMAIRRRGLAGRVVGLSRRAQTLRLARRLGAVDWGTTDPAAAAREADLLIVATPVDRIIPVAQRCARQMRLGSIISDVGSTKSHIVDTLQRTLPEGLAFVGAHPIAGSEARGIRAAQPRLFDGATCLLTPTAHTDRRALRRVAQLWRSLSGRVLLMTPPRHDALLAATSHLPHLLAFCLALTVDPTAPCVPRSFLDMTRVAKSGPALWDDIFLANRTELLAALDRMERQVHRMRRQLTRSDRAGLRRLLARANATCEALERCA